MLSFMNCRWQAIIFGAVRERDAALLRIPAAPNHIGRALLVTSTLGPAAKTGPRATAEWRGSGRGGTVIDRRDEPSFGDLNQSVEIGKQHPEKAG